MVRVSPTPEPPISRQQGSIEQRPSRGSWIQRLPFVQWVSALLSPKQSLLSKLSGEASKISEELNTLSREQIKEVNNHARKCLEIARKPLKYSIKDLPQVDMEPIKELLSLQKSFQQLYNRAVQAVVPNTQRCYEQFDTFLKGPTSRAIGLVERHEASLLEEMRHYASIYNPNSTRLCRFDRPTEVYFTDPQTYATTTVRIEPPLYNEEMPERDLCQYLECLREAVNGGSAKKLDDDFLKKHPILKTLAKKYPDLEEEIMRFTQQVERRFKEDLHGLRSGGQEWLASQPAYRGLTPSDTVGCLAAASQGNLFVTKSGLSLSPVIPTDPAAAQACTGVGEAARALYPQEWSQGGTSSAKHGPFSYTLQTEIKQHSAGFSYAEATYTVQDSQGHKATRQAIYRLDEEAVVPTATHIERDLLLAKAEWARTYADPTKKIARPGEEATIRTTLNALSFSELVTLSEMVVKDAGFAGQIRQHALQGSADAIKNLMEAAQATPSSRAREQIRAIRGGR